MRNEINLSDEQIEQAFREAGDDIGLDCTVEDVVLTREALTNFIAARRHYEEKGRILKQTETTLCVEGVQPFRSQKRRNLVVVDFGTVRGAVTL